MSREKCIFALVMETDLHFMVAPHGEIVLLEVSPDSNMFIPFAITPAGTGIQISLDWSYYSPAQRFSTGFIDITIRGRGIVNFVDVITLAVAIQAKKYYTSCKN